MDEPEIRRQLKLQKQWDKLDELEINDFILAALGRREGRRFIWWLLEVGQVNTQPFAGEKTQITAFNCGAMNVGNQILARLLEVNPDGYLSMLKEKQNERRERNPAPGGSDDDPSGSAGSADYS